LDGVGNVEDHISEIGKGSESDVSNATAANKNVPVDLLLQTIYLSHFTISGN